MGALLVQSRLDEPYGNTCWESEPSSACMVIEHCLDKLLSQNGEFLSTSLALCYGLLRQRLFCGVQQDAVTISSFCNHQLLASIYMNFFACNFNHTLFMLRFSCPLRRHGRSRGQRRARLPLLTLGGGLHFKAHRRVLNSRCSSPG